MSETTKELVDQIAECKKRMRARNAIEEEEARHQFARRMARHRETLRFLRYIGPEPLPIFNTLLVNNVHAMPVPEHNLPPPCPGTQSLFAVADPFQFGNVVLMTKEDRDLNYTHPWLVNVAVTFFLGIHKLELDVIVKILPGFTTHTNGRRPALTQKYAFDEHPVPGVMTAHTYSTGKVVITGARTTNQALDYAHQMVSCMNRCRLECLVLDFKVENIVGTMDFGFNVNLGEIAREYGHLMFYDPEIFPAVMYRKRPKPSPVALFNLSGKGVYVGLKSPDEVAQMHREMSSIAQQFRITAATAASESQQRLTRHNHMTSVDDLAEAIDIMNLLNTAPPADAHAHPTFNVGALTYAQMGTLTDVVDRLIDTAKPVNRPLFIEEV